MARVTHVKKARQSKRTRVCKACHKPIEVGTPYKWFATRIGRSSYRKDYHAACSIPRSHTTTSDKLGQLYDAQDNIEAAVGKDDIAQALNDAAEVARDVASQYEESADNIVDGFGHETMQSEEIREKAQACEAWADALEDAASEVENLSEDDVDTDDLTQNVLDALSIDEDDLDVEGNEQHADAWQTELDELLADLARDKADDAEGELEL